MHRLWSASAPVHVRADLPSPSQLLQGMGRVWNNSFVILLQTLQVDQWGPPGPATFIFSSQHRSLEDVEVWLLSQFLLRARTRPDPPRDHPKHSGVDVRIGNPLGDRFCLRWFVGGEPLAWRGNLYSSTLALRFSPERMVRKELVTSAKRVSGSVVPWLLAKSINNFATGSHLDPVGYLLSDTSCRLAPNDQANKALDRRTPLAKV